ncbi:MAG: glycine C-acetyltransferase [bacterium]|nr:glycine C-acetyltransferase [bacterium]
MVSEQIQKLLQNELLGLFEKGLYKSERVLSTPQGNTIQVNGKTLLNFCANNYLGLANHPKIIEAAKLALERWGFGLSSVRFICGTLEIHKELEQVIANFFQTEDTILYAACFDANGGVFEPLFNEDDCIFSDELNHASIIDGIRLSKAKRFRYRHAEMNHLEELLKQNHSAKKKIIVTDGVFSMDGDIAPLQEICALAEKYEALVMVDDCHGSGVIGPTGRGSCEETGVLQKVDIITSTLGKALGGANGGFTTGKKEIIEWLRQKSRPYLFSNSLPPVIVAASIEAFQLVKTMPELRTRLKENTELFRKKMKEAGFDVRGTTPIVPVLLKDAQLAQAMSNELFEKGIYVIGFFYPVVAKGQERIRVQISAIHTTEDILFAVDAFTQIGKKLGIIH